MKIIYNLLNKISPKNIGIAMNKYLLVIFLLSTSSYAHMRHDPISIDGNYICTGSEIDQKTRFKCELSFKKTEQTYASRVVCNDGTTYISTGIYDPIKHSISLVSVNPKNSKEIGVAVVDVKKDGSLVSVWTYLHKTTVGHTHCIKRKI
jgi:hypothetical protein